MAQTVMAMLETSRPVKVKIISLCVENLTEYYSTVLLASISAFSKFLFMSPAHLSFLRISFKALSPCIFPSTQIHTLLISSEWSDPVLDDHCCWGGMQGVRGSVEAAETCRNWEWGGAGTGECLMKHEVVRFGFLRCKRCSLLGWGRYSAAENNNKTPYLSNLVLRVV